MLNHHTLCDKCWGVRAKLRYMIKQYEEKLKRFKRYSEEKEIKELKQNLGIK